MGPDITTVGSMWAGKDPLTLGTSHFGVQHDTDLSEAGLRPMRPDPRQAFLSVRLVGGGWANPASVTQKEVNQ